MDNTFYITTPILRGQFAAFGAFVRRCVADAIRRHKRQRGFDTYFLTGTDEHGINIQRAAERTGEHLKSRSIRSRAN
ncbi:MAG: class I tRNA ligase family protein [Acidobacteria bacterium]|nr:class I tRNA ligase family protein [Acidobacteriota bacterium]